MTGKAWKLLLVCSLIGWFALPATATDNNPQQTAALLATCLKQEGYLGNYPHGQELQRGISAYLWDHRHWLVDTDFHRSRDTETLICLLHAKGYPQFSDRIRDRYLSGWCEQKVKRP